MRGRVVAALDMGAHEVRLAAVVIEQGVTRLAALSAAQSRGMQRGMVVDIHEAAAAVSEAVNALRTRAGIGVKHAVIGVSGPHVRCQESVGFTALRGRRVTERDVERAMAGAMSPYMPMDRMALHFLVKEFRIDGQRGVARPHGMAGVMLEAAVNVISAQRSVVENLMQCCERAGLEVISAVSEPLACIKAVASSEEAQGGVAVVDIGSASTEIAVMKAGALVDCHVLPVGGDHVTSDIAIGLKLPHREAERIKLLHGSLFEGAGREAQGFEAQCADGVRRGIPMRYLREIVFARYEELMEMSAEKVALTLPFRSPACVVLTGAGARIPGLDRLAEAKMGLPVRLGSARATRVIEIAGGLMEPEFATVVGISLLAVEGGHLKSGAFEKFKHALGRVKGDLFDALWGDGHVRPVRQGFEKSISKGGNYV